MRGIVAKNVDPTPGSLSTETLPPSKSGQFPGQGQPQARPLDPFLHGLSIWPNSSKIRSRSSAAMPMPVSLTEKMTMSSGPDCARDPDLAVLGEFHGVGEEIPQDLGDLSLVGLERRDPVRLFKR